MTNPGMPEWALEIPWANVHQERPNQLVRPFTAQQLLQIGGELIEQFIKRVVLAVAGFFIPGDLGAAFEQLKAWGDRVAAMFSNLAALFGIEDTDLDGDIDIHDVWSTVVTTFIQPLLDLFGAIGDGLNAILGPIFGGLDFTDLPTPAEVWQTVINTLMLPLNLLLGPSSPLNALNIFGRLQLPQFGGGVPLSALTPSVPNELEPFTATSVPTVDGWSFNAGQDAAQVVADGSTKTLYLQSGVIKVEAGQPLDTGVSVTYSGVSSGAGQAIRYVLETFTSDDGSGTATPVTVGSVSNPSGTITTPVSLSNSSWAIPAGVQSVRPVLVVDSLVTAGTVFWKNTPTLKKKLAGQLAGGLPNALDNAGQAIRDAIANALGHSGTGHTSANILTYLQSIPQTVVSGLGDLNTLTNQIRDILAGLVVTPINSTVQAIKDWFTGVVGKTQNLTSGGNLPPANVGSPTGGTNIGQDILDTLNGIWAGLRGAGSAAGKTPTDVATATAATADLVTQVSSIAARLDTSVSQVIKGGGGGTSDQFEREGTDLGDDWDVTVTGAGGLITDGNSVRWSPSGGSAASEVARNITVETATNWQNVGFVLTEPLNTTSGWMLIGRSNAARTTYTYMFVKKNYREIGYVISGTPTILTSSTDPYDPPPGAKIIGYFGHEWFTEDTFILASPSLGAGLDAVSTAPSKGAGFRHMGFGAKVGVASGSQVSPGALELWTGGDSKSPPTVGVYLAAERSFLSGYATLSTGNLPSGFLTVTRQSDWISFDTSTNTFTVELPGAYHVWATLSMAVNLTSGNSVDLRTFPVGGSPDLMLYAPRLVPGGGIEQQLSGVLYLEAGAQIQLVCELAGSATKKAIGGLRVAKLSPPYFA